MFFDNELWIEICERLGEHGDITNQKKIFRAVPDITKITDDEDYSRTTYDDLDTLWKDSNLDQPCDIHLVVLVYPYTPVNIHVQNAKRVVYYHWDDLFHQYTVPSIQPILPTNQDTPNVLQCPYTVIKRVQEAIQEKALLNLPRNMDIMFCGNTDDKSRNWRKLWLQFFGESLKKGGTLFKDELLKKEDDFFNTLLQKVPTFYNIDSSIHYASYAELAVQSKVIICPRGIAQHTWRMFEAIIAGACPVAQEVTQERWWRNQPPPIEFFSYNMDEAALSCKRTLAEWDQRTKAARDWFNRVYSKNEIEKWVSEAVGFIMQKN